MDGHRRARAVEGGRGRSKAATGAKACPFCGSHDTERLSDFGTSVMVASYHCRTCHSAFEAIKWGDASAALDLPPFLRRPRP